MLLYLSLMINKIKFFTMVNNIFFKFKIIFIVSILLTGCFFDNDKITISKNAIIVSFGDSLTYGTGANKSKSYPSVLAKILGIAVINGGVPGEVTSLALNRIDLVIRQNNPNLVIIMHGGNDILRGLRLEEIYNNLDKIITKLLSNNIKIILIGVPKKSVLLKDAAIYKKLANKHNILYIDGLLASLLSNNSLKSDIIHLNAKGYNKLAEGIAKHINILP